jgi:hypothetical protein
MSAQIDDGGPAFPSDSDTYNGTGLCGMSLRDWFAGQALPKVFCAFSKDCQAEIEDAAGSNLNPAGEGCSLSSWMMDAGDPYWAKGIANACYNIADAMIEARKGGEQ